MYPQKRFPYNKRKHLEIGTDGYHLVYEDYDFRSSSSWYVGGGYVYK